MNVGQDRSKAIEHAKANTRTDNRPRFLHIYGGVYWLSKEAPRCGHTMVTPQGEVIDYEEGMAWHLYRLRTEPEYAAEAERNGQEIMDLIPDKE